MSILSGVMAAAVGCVTVLMAAPPLLTPEQAAAQIKQHKKALEGKVIASLPTLVSDSEMPLNSMGPVPTSSQCFAAWHRAMTRLVELDYLSGFLKTEHTIGVTDGHLTNKGEPFFGPVWPKRFHTSVRIVPPMHEATITVTEIHTGPGSREAQVEFRCPPCEPFAILHENGLLDQQCRGSVDAAIVMETGEIRGHAHFRFKKGTWRIVRVELGPHSESE